MATSVGPLVKDFHKEPLKFDFLPSDVNFVCHTKRWSGPMSEISSVISSIRAKVEKLGNENLTLRASVQNLESEKFQLLDKISTQKQDIDELKSKERALRIALSVEGSGEKASDIKLKINGLVREIDKCIALLNK